MNNSFALLLGPSHFCPVGGGEMISHLVQTLKIRSMLFYDHIKRVISVWGVKYSTEQQFI